MVPNFHLAACTVLVSLLWTLLPLNSANVLRTCCGSAANSTRMDQSSTLLSSRQLLQQILDPSQVAASCLLTVRYGAAVGDIARLRCNRRPARGLVLPNLSMQTHKTQC